MHVQHGYGHTCLHASARGGVTRALSLLSLPLALSCKEPSGALWSVVASGPRNLFRNGEFRPICTSFRFSPSHGVSTVEDALCARQTALLTYLGCNPNLCYYANLPCPRHPRQPAGLFF